MGDSIYRQGQRRDCPHRWRGTVGRRQICLFLRAPALGGMASTRSLGSSTSPFVSAVSTMLCRRLWLRMEASEALAVISGCRNQRWATFTSIRPTSWRSRRGPNSQPMNRAVSVKVRARGGRPLSALASGAVRARMHEELAVVSSVPISSAACWAGAFQQACQTKKALARARALSESGASLSQARMRRSLFVTRTRQRQDELEHIDEVQVKGQCTHDRGLLHHLAVVGEIAVILLEALCVPCGQAGENEHAD